MKHILGISLSSLAITAVAIPSSLALVSCAEEQDKLNSNQTNANRPSNGNSNHNNKPSTTKPNPPTTAPSTPAPKPEPNSDLRYNSSQLRKIYDNINSKLNGIKNGADPLPKLTYAYLNNDGTSKQTDANAKATTSGFKSSVMSYIKQTMGNKSLAKSIKSATFDVNRYNESVTFSINFFPKALSGNPIFNKNYIAYGDDGKDKNTLVMTFSMPNIGLAKYVSYHDLEKASQSVHEYVQAIYDKSIEDLNYDTLNGNLSQLWPIMEKHGVNYALLKRDSSRFDFPDIPENTVTWYSGYEVDQDGVTLDPNCASGPGWEFRWKYAVFNITWSGNLDTLFNQQRLNIVDLQSEKEITKIAETGLRDPKQLLKQINTPAFSKKIWDMEFKYGFKFVEQGTKLYPKIDFFAADVGKDRFGDDAFIYKYRFTLPASTPVSNSIQNNSWVQKHFKITKNSKGTTFECIQYMAASFVEDPY